MALLLLVLFSFPKESEALSCVQPPPPNIAYDEYDAVLIGTVDKIDEKFGKKKLTIKVVRSFKGVNEKTITVKEDLTWGQSELNAAYLFFLKKEGNNWTHPLCSPTTNDVSVADLFLADKEEIPLKAVMDNEIESKEIKNNPYLATILSVGILTLASVIILRRKKIKNKKIDR